MSELLTRPTVGPADESQLRRAERGVVAGYIHELSTRHVDSHAPEPNAQPSPERSEGG
jgi:hypothetical protein